MFDVTLHFEQHIENLNNLDFFHQHSFLKREIINPRLLWHFLVAFVSVTSCSFSSNLFPVSIFLTSANREKSLETKSGENSDWRSHSQITFFCHPQGQLKDILGFSTTPARNKSIFSFERWLPLYFHALWSSTESFCWNLATNRLIVYFLFLN